MNNVKRFINNPYKRIPCFQVQEYNGMNNMRIRSIKFPTTFYNITQSTNRLAFLTYLNNKVQLNVMYIPPSTYTSTSVLLSTIYNIFSTTKAFVYAGVDDTGAPVENVITAMSVKSISQLETSSIAIKFSVPIIPVTLPEYIPDVNIDYKRLDSDNNKYYTLFKNTTSDIWKVLGIRSYNIESSELYDTDISTTVDVNGDGIIDEMDIIFKNVTMFNKYGYIQELHDFKLYDKFYESYVDFNSDITLLTDLFNDTVNAVNAVNMGLPSKFRVHATVVSEIETLLNHTPDEQLELSKLYDISLLGRNEVNIIYNGVDIQCDINKYITIPRNKILYIFIDCTDARYAIPPGVSMELEVEYIS